MLCSEYLLHTSLVVLYFFTFTVFACERNARVETEKNPELKLYSCRNVSTEYFTNTHIVRLADLGVGVKELKLRVTTAYILLSAHVRLSHSLSKWWNSTSLGLVQDLGLKKKKSYSVLQIWFLSPTKKMADTHEHWDKNATCNFGAMDL